MGQSLTKELNIQINIRKNRKWYCKNRVIKLKLATMDENILIEIIRDVGGFQKEESLHGEQEEK